MVGTWWSNKIWVLSVTVLVYWTKHAGSKAIALDMSARVLRKAFYAMKAYKRQRLNMISIRVVLAIIRIFLVRVAVLGCVLDGMLHHWRR